MFLEPNFRGQRSGWIEVICGSMFSGKTEELIRRLKRAQIAGQILRVYKPEKDVRYHQDRVVSHDENIFTSTSVPAAREILQDLNCEVIGIDEAQFFDLDLVDVCERLALKGIRVIVAGLDMDYRGMPFGPIPHLLAVAEYITKVHAICNHCGNLATHSYRLSNNDEQVLLGERDKYEARCRVCYTMGNILNLTKNSKK